MAYDAEERGDAGAAFRRSPEGRGGRAVCIVAWLAKGNAIGFPTLSASPPAGPVATKRGLCRGFLAPSGAVPGRQRDPG